MAKDYSSDVIRRAKAAEERTRPVTAEVTVKGGAAVLRLLDRGGHVSADRYRIILPGTVDYLCGSVLTLADEFIVAAGFRLDGGWTDPTEWNTPDGEQARTLLDVTPEYLAYVERQFGPPPTLGEQPKGMTAHRTEWGEWQLCYQNRRFYALKWTPKLTGPEWTLSATTGNYTSEHESAQDALAAAVE